MNKKYSIFSNILFLCGIIYFSVLVYEASSIIHVVNTIEELPVIRCGTCLTALIPNDPHGLLIPNQNRNIYKSLSAHNKDNIAIDINNGVETDIKNGVKNRTKNNNMNNDGRNNKSGKDSGNTPFVNENIEPTLYNEILTILNNKKQSVVPVSSDESNEGANFLESIFDIIDKK